jgi:hypothetical protein
MLTLLIFPGGRRADAVLLSAERNCLRLAVAGRADTMELVSADKWISENRSPVEIGAIFAAAGSGQAQLARAMAAAQLSC